MILNTVSRLAFFSLMLTLLVVVQAFAGLDQLMVVKVNGKIMVNKKNTLAPGQKIKTTDFVFFGQMTDFFIGIHPQIGKVVLKPGSKFDLNAKMPLGELLIPFSGQRGINDVHFNYQTVSDTLRLNLHNDLRLKEVQPNSSFLLYDLWMNNSLKWVNRDTTYLYVVASKKGMQFLHFLSRPGAVSRTVAEIEFLDEKEIVQELKYLSKMEENTDPKANIEAYMKKQYGLLPKEETGRLLALVP